MAVLTLLTSVVVGASTPLTAHANGSAVGSFEIDGNLVDNPAGEPIDWSTPPPNLTNFTDATGSKDDSFNNGSKETAPGAWSCQTGSAPAKDDIVSGQVAFRTYTDGKQYVYVDFTRKGVNGDAHVDYEFNQSSTPNPSCPALPARTDGDILISFDTNNGGASITVSAYKWVFDLNSTTTGTFVPLGVGSEHTTWEGAVNIPNTIPNHTAGDFGEAALNLTDTIGTIHCGDFASVDMKTRSSTSISSTLQDRTTTKPVNLGDCPSSSLAKAVRDPTAPTGGTSATTATAKPGDVLEYRLTYANAGPGAATNVVISDTIAARQTFVANSCNPTCTTDGPPVSTVTWTFATVPSGGTQVVTFQVTLDATFPSGGTIVSNVGTVDTKEEPPKSSNTTTVTVNAAANITSTKSVSPTVAKVGDTVTYTITLNNSGDANGTTTVTDNYDQAHLTIGPANPPVTSNNGDVLTWSNIAVPAHGSTVITYTATVKGTFSGSNGTCQPGQFPVVNSVTLTVGTGSNETLCVTASPTITSQKSVSPQVASVGDTVTYTITLTNSGTATGTTTVTDNYDQSHLQILTTSPTATNNGDTLVWSNVSVSTKKTTVLTYTAKVIGTFSSGSGTGGCSTGQFPVVNSVTLTVGTGTGATLCVTAAPNITSSKAVTPNPASVGQTVTYTITLDNTKGTADGTTTVTDNYDQNHLQITSSTPTATNNGDTLVWSNVVVPAGQTVTLTYTAKVIGTYNSGANTGGCTNGNFPVVNTVTLTVGTGTNKTLCVIATPNITSTKTVNPASANIGDTVTYTITLRNNGSATGTTTVTDDYDQAHVTIGTVTPAASTNDGDKLTWANVVVPAGNTPIILTYTATVKGTFSGSNGTCGPNQFPVLNSVTLTVGTGTGATLCVNGPILHITKSACPTPNAVPGGVLTYTIAYSNSGSAAATGTTITDTLPAGESFVAASNNGSYDPNTNTVTWSIGTVNANGTGSVTLQVLVTASNGDSLTNTATISATNASSVTSTPVTSPVSNAGAITHGSAYGVDAELLAIPLINFGEIDTVAPGAPQSAASNLLTVPLDPLVNIKAVTQLSNSSVNDEATSTSSSTVANVNLLNGLITADVVKGVAQSDASALSASSNSNGSTFTNLKINGNSITNVTPNMHVDVKDPLTGLITIASVTLEEETKSANLANGFFTTSESINMIHVVLLAPLGVLPAGANIVVAHANTDATYPSGVACGTTPAMVSGEAFTVSALGTLNGVNLLTAKVGDAAITPFGGSDSDGPVVVTTAPLLAAAATNTTSGSTTPLPSSTARSVVTGANVLDGLVTADVLDVQSNSTTTATTATSSVATTIANLKILGLPVNVTITPNTVIAVVLPGGSLLVVTIDERIFGGDGVNNTEATVHALHVQVFGLDGLITADVIVASAHSDAHKAHAS